MYRRRYWARFFTNPRNGYPNVLSSWAGKAVDAECSRDGLFAVVRAVFILKCIGCPHTYLAHWVGGTPMV